MNYVQYELGCAVQTRRCSTNQAHIQYEQGCAAQIRNIFSMSEDVQHKQVDHQVLVQGDNAKNNFHLIGH